MELVDLKMTAETFKMEKYHIFTHKKKQAAQVF